MRKLFWVTLSFSAAIFLSVYLLPEPYLLPAGIFCAVTGITTLFLQENTRRKVALAAFGLCAGFLWTSCYTALFRTPAHAMASKEALVCTVTVLDHPSETDNGYSLPVRLTGPNGRPYKVLLYADEAYASLGPGDEISLPLRLSKSDVLRGERFDYYDARGIYLIGYPKGKILTLRHPDTLSLRFLLQQAAHALKTSITRIFPQDVTPFLIALTTGDKSSLPAGLYAAFQRGGVAHIVAVSGLHVSFLIGLLSALFGKRSKLTFGLGVTLIFFFVLLTGASPSALRAAFMIFFVLLAPLTGREEDRPTTFIVILALLLFLNPYSAASVSLQLSFAAVAGIYSLTPILYSRWVKALPEGEHQLTKLFFALCRAAVGVLATTLGALLFTTPLTVLHFRTLSLLGPVTNLLVMWLVPLLFVGTLALSLVGLLFPRLALPFAWLLAFPVRWVMEVVKAIARLPLASLSLNAALLLIWAMIAYLILLIWFFFRREIRPAIPISVLGLTLCLALLFHILPAYTSALSITALDVGQGASTLLFSKGNSVLVDCGGSGAEDPGDVAADYLQLLGRSQLDLLILTHYHSDHAGGVPQLFSRVKVKHILMPDVEPSSPLRLEILKLAKEYGCDVTLLSKDITTDFGAASLTIFAPLGDGGANEEGLSLICTSGEFDALITGDMNAMMEQMLVKYKSLPDIELLLVGHHGSRNSTSEELLLATTPEQAIISCGYNTYGHPNEETLERLGAAGCELYRTDQMGSITLTVK